MPIKRIDHLTKQKRKELEEKEKERQREEEELFSPPEGLPPEALEFPGINISADNMAVAGSGSNWEKAEGEANMKRLIRYLRQEVKYLHGTAEEILERIAKKQQEGPPV